MNELMNLVNEIVITTAQLETKLQVKNVWFWRDDLLE